MTTEQLQALGPALADFLQPFLFCCGYTQTFDHLQVYCRGLLTDLPRKSVEPMASAAGTPVRTLQEFLRDHVWSRTQVRDLLQEYVRDFLPDVADDGLGTVGLVDETGQPKKGTKTPGVQRQHCGRLGKVDNCIVTVHLGICKGTYKTLLDGDLFLPSGLKPGENIVVGANFLIDAESNLRAALQTFSAPEQSLQGGAP